MSDEGPSVIPGNKQKKPPVGVKPTVKIRLEENDNIPPTGLFLSVNGRSFLIPTGVDVNVPEVVVNVLKDAIISVPTVDPQTRQVIGYRDRMRYPFTQVAA
jgi:hypothetical protein